VGVIVALYYLLLPLVAYRLVASGAMLEAGAVVVLGGVARFRPRRARAWYLLAGAVALAGLGDLAHGIAVWPSSLDRLPPIAGLCYLGAYVLQIGAVTGMTTARWGLRSFMDLVDGLVVAVAVALASWELLVAPHASAVGIEADAGFLSLLLPTMSVTLVWMVWRFLTRPRPGPFAGGVVLTAFLLMAIGAIAALAVSQGLTQDPSLWFLGVFPFANLLLCSAALHPSMRNLTEPVDDQRPRAVWGRIATLGVASATGIGVIIQATREVDTAAVTGGVILVLLVVLRLAMVLYVMDDELRRRFRLETRYRSVLQSLEEGVVVQDDAGRVLDANPAAARITGVNLDDLTGSPFAPDWQAVTVDGVPLPPERRPGRIALATGESRTGVELGVVHPDGTVRWIELNISPVTMPAGEPDQLVVASFRDITERLRLAEVATLSRQRVTEAELAAKEQALKRAAAEQASRAKNEFLSRMSHELRTPLNAVLGFGQLLALADLPGDNAEHVERILSGGHHLLELINEVLDISRIESGHLAINIEPVAVTEAVDRAVTLIQPLAASHGIDVRPSIGHSTLWMHADRQRFQQVMLNLL
jgi:PAS domain S-box-containing protein